MSRPATPTDSSVPTVENIQALRAIAALMVVWSHASDWAFGAAGVDIFFVISGFVISLVVDKRHRGPTEFLLARVARIAPLYLVMTLYECARHPGRFSFASIWNGCFYLPLFDHGTYTIPPLLVGWSLSFEMMFYLVFGLLLVWLTTRQVARVLPIVLAVFAVLGIFYTGGWYFPRFVSHPLVLEFALGCAIYQWRGRLRGSVPFLALALALTGFALSWPWVDYCECARMLASDKLAWIRVGAWGLPAALLVASCVGLEYHWKFTLPRLLSALGATSYALYLTHPVVLTFTASLPFGALSPFLIAVARVLICVAAGCLCHWLVERPLTHWAQRGARWLVQGPFSSRPAPVAGPVPDSAS